MTFPTAAVNTTNCDAAGDVPATFRADTLDGLQKLNQIIAHVSTYIATLLDDTTAAAARTTLGSTTVGDAVFIAVSAAAARTALGAGTGDKAFTVSSQSAAYAPVLTDADSVALLHPASDTTARTWTIPANSSVAYPVGSVLTFINQNAAGTLTISITTDTMRLAGAGTTGSRTLAANGIATAIKITSTEWIISGTGLT